MLFLNEEDVKQSISMKEAIEAMKSAFGQLTLGEAIVPLRTAIRMDKNMGSTRFMPAYLFGSDEAGIKVTSNFKNNRTIGLPTLIATVFLFDPKTGKPLAILGGTYLTALRTGAASGLATNLLANQNARVLSIFGAGAQARTQLQSVCEVRDIQEIWIYDVDPRIGEIFVEDVKSWKGRIPKEIRLAKTSQEAVNHADVICTATTSATPVFEGKDLKSGTHLNGVGSFTPESREIGTETVRRAKIVVDHRSTALAEAGDLIIPIKEGVIKESDIYAELGELVLGKKRGRESEKEITFFKSVGSAVQDLVVGMKVLQNARERKLGIEVPM